MSNVESCRQLNTQILASLRCSGGTDTGDGCLSDPQLATIRAIESPLDFTSYALANGVKRAGGYNLLEGALVAGPYTTRDLGTRPAPANPATSADANMYVTGDQWVKFFVTRDRRLRLADLRSARPRRLYGARDRGLGHHRRHRPDSRPFLSRGGRLILLHGLADEVISPNSTIDYYQQLIATVGQDAVDRGVRFYTVPGMGHGTGVFIPAWDSLAALEGWVEARPGAGHRRGDRLAWPAPSAARGRCASSRPGPSTAAAAASTRRSTTAACRKQPIRSPARTCRPRPRTTRAATVRRGARRAGRPVDDGLYRHDRCQPAARGGTQRSGTLVAQGNCSYGSTENGAVFSFAAGGVLQGGVAAPAGSSFLPLAAFRNTFENAATPTVFNPVANIFNAVGVQQGAGGTGPCLGRAAAQCGYLPVLPRPGDRPLHDLRPQLHPDREGLHRLRCRPQGLRRLHHLADRRRRPPPAARCSGSMVIGLVNGAAAPLHLVRDVDGHQGMRMLAVQQSLSSGAADGVYAVASVQGETREATIAGSSFNLGGAAAELAYDTPVAGVVQADAGTPGQFHLQQRHPRLRLHLGLERGAGTRSAPLMKNKHEAFARPARSASLAAWATHAASPAPASCPAPGAEQPRAATPAQDGAGAFYWIAIPRDWNRVLVMHAHGGPETGPPSSSAARKT